LTKMSRISKDEYYLNIAEAVVARGTCLRRNFGSVIVKDDQIISTGYVGSPRGVENCCDKGTCLRQDQNIPRGERYELCLRIHSECNAIIHASREQMLGSTLYLVGIEKSTGKFVENTQPCAMCKRMIVNAGISKVVVRDGLDLRTVDVESFLRDESIKGTCGY